MHTYLREHQVLLLISMADYTLKLTVCGSERLNALLCTSTIVASSNPMHVDNIRTV